MKKIIIIVFVLIANIYFSQTYTRKTRSDKGGTHTHSTSYNLKKALKPKSTATKSSTKRKK